MKREYILERWMNSPENMVKVLILLKNKYFKVSIKEMLKLLGLRGILMEYTQGNL